MTTQAKNSKGIYLRGKTWWITYAGADGKQKFESSGSRLKADARYLLTKRHKEIAEGLSPLATTHRAKNATFADLAEKYSAFIANQKAAATKRAFINDLLAEFGNYKLNRLNLAALEVWQSRLLTEPRTGRKQGSILPPLTPASVNRRIACFKHMMTKARDWEMIPQTTLDTLRRVKLTREENRRLRFLSVAEFEELIAAADDELKPILVFAFNTGCRRGEILGLTWDRVDFKHGFIRLDKTKSGEPRNVPINQVLRDALKKLIRRVDSPFVFYNPATGNKWQELRRSFARACRKAKIHDFKFHDLRHTFASQLVMAGVDLTTVSRMLGHASLTMTLRYSHLAPDHLQKAVDVLSVLQDPQAENTKQAARA